MIKSIVFTASLVLITLLSFFTFSNHTVNPRADRVFENNFESYDNVYEIVNGENLEANTLRSGAFQAYDLGDYLTAAARFKELVKIDRSAINYFYMGISNLEGNSTDLAIENLNATLNNFDEFDSDAKWYLALAHLSNGDEEAAVSNLVSLTLDTSIYKEKAEAILKEMGLSVSSLDGGVITDVKIRPKDDDDTPSGVTFDTRRKIQYGLVLSETDNYHYSFLTDEPIFELHIGSEVEMIIINRANSEKTGFAFILGVRN